MLPQRTALPQPKVRTDEFGTKVNTLDDLKRQTGPYSDTAAAFATAHAVRAWACNGMDRKGQGKCHPERVIFLALSLHMAQIWRELGITRHGIVALCDLKPETRSELEEVVSDTYAEWEAAGSPGLTPDLLWFAYRYLHGHIWMGDLAPFPGSMPTPPSAHLGFKPTATQTI